MEIVTSFDGATYMDSSSTAGGRRTVSVTFSGKKKKKKVHLFVHRGAIKTDGN